MKVSQSNATVYTLADASGQATVLCIGGEISTIHWQELIGSELSEKIELTLDRPAPESVLTQDPLWLVRTAREYTHHLNTLRGRLDYGAPKAMVVWVGAHVAGTLNDQRAQVLGTKDRRVLVRLLGNDNEAWVGLDEIVGLEIGPQSLRFAVGRVRYQR